MAAPSSQKAADRPISFLLDNQLTGQSQSITLPIRPEDLRRTEPALQTVTPTFGGAWIDDFGPGLAQIVISGHTGWRGGATLDGVQSFFALREQVWNQWHVQRAQAIANSQSPDQIKLIYVDTLNQITAVVAPGQMNLQRSRSRPLLLMYQIPMTVVADTLDQPTLDALSLLPDGSSTNPDQAATGLESLANSADTLASLAPQAQLYLPNSDQAIAGLMSNGSALLSAVGVASDISAAASLAAPVCAASRDLLWAYVQATNYIGQQLMPLVQAASAFENAVCVLANVFGSALSYVDLSSLQGASNCSSTLGAGGLSPYLGANPFATVAAAAALPIAITSQGAAALAAAAQLDPVLGDYTPTELVNLASGLNAGIIA